MFIVSRTVKLMLDGGLSLGCRDKLFTGATRFMTLLFVLGGQDPQKMVISDSILKRLTQSDIKGTKLVAMPGKKFASAYKDIKAGRITVAHKSAVAIMLGTNDIDNVVYSQFGPVGYKLQVKNHHAPPHPVTMQDVVRDFDTLVQCVRQLNPEGTIVIVAVVPRKGDWPWSKDLVIELNDHMQVWCCGQQQEGNNAIFVPSYKFFLRAGLPKPEYYAWDGIHLSNEGLRRIRQALQQALSEASLRRGGFWRRKPEGRGNPRESRKRVEQGNLIVFQ